MRFRQASASPGGHSVSTESAQSSGRSWLRKSPLSGGIGSIAMWPVKGSGSRRRMLHIQPSKPASSSSLDRASTIQKTPREIKNSYTDLLRKDGTLPANYRPGDPRTPSAPTLMYPAATPAPAPHSTPPNARTPTRHERNPPPSRPFSCSCRVTSPAIHDATHAAPIA